MEALSRRGATVRVRPGLYARNLASHSLAPGIAVSLSALTSIIQLQQQGYALVPL